MRFNGARACVAALDEQPKGRRHPVELILDGDEPVVQVGRLLIHASSPSSDHTQARRPRSSL